MQQPTDQLSQLTDARKDAKRAEQEAAATRISIESQIYELTSDKLADKGTYTTPTGMKIVTGYTESWDQQKLTEAYNQWQAPVAFPFTGQWKPDGKAVSYLRDNAPDLYKLIQPALTISPKKPAFSFKE